MIVLSRHLGDRLSRFEIKCLINIMNVFDVLVVYNIDAHILPFVSKATTREILGITALDLKELLFPLYCQLILLKSE